MQDKPLDVLLIEHDAAFARSVTAMLEQARDVIGRVFVTATLEEGLEQLARNEFAVVLLEFSLPDGAGLANIALLKAEAPRVPFILIAGADDETVAGEAMQIGAQDYLVRSQINPHWLLRSIRYAVERHHADMTVLEAEEKYRGIFDHLVEGIFRTTPDGRYLLANLAMARLYGYTSPGELMSQMTDIGSTLYVLPGRREEFKRTMDEHDTITAFESQIYRKDGSTIWISEDCRAVRDGHGTLLYYEGTVEDITARREAEDNVRRSEVLYHSLVETIPQGVFRRDLQGRFTFVNKPFCKYLKLKPEDILGKSDFDLHPKKAAEKYWRDDLRIMESGEPMTIIEETQPVGATEKQYHHVTKTPLYGLDGKVCGLQGMFWDITKERQMEEQLRHSEALYHSLVETMPHNIFRKDLHGRYTFANTQFCRTMGHSLEQIIGKTVFDFLPREVAEQRQADDQRVMLSGTNYSQVEENMFAGGEHQYIHVLKMPIFDMNGRVTGLQGMFWDITEQKAAEQRIRKANADLAQSREELRRKNDQMQDDLKMASEIQVSMLPQQYPRFPRGAAADESAFRFTHRYKPTGEVGGDFFTVSALSDTEASVFICDVAGHGVRSALVTAMIRALVEELKPVSGSPGEFLTGLNSGLFAILQHAGTPVLTTAFYFVASSQTGLLRYANAGHPKPFHVRRASGKVETLKNSSKESQPALGLFAKAAYHTSEVTLEPRDLVMLFTDGLFEVESPKGELFSEAMLAADVLKHIHKPTANLFDDLLKFIRNFAANQEFTDDVCLVGMELAAKKAG